MQPNEKYMQMAIEKAKQGLATGQSPFGACIVRNDEVVSCEHNIVWQSTDITAHGEINAIRQACKKLNTVDLSGCVIYSTCEPCPMCFAACHWAKFDGIIYGSSIADAQGAGFSELTISNEQMKQFGQSKVEIISGFMAEQCNELFRIWSGKQDRRLY